MVAGLRRDDWIRGAEALLVAEGVEGFGVEPLARRLGVTKGSYYHHFTRRRDVLDAMLARWEDVGTETIIVAVDETTADPVERLRELGRRTFLEGTAADELEPALRAWAASDPAAAAVVTRVDARRVGYAAELLVAAGVDAVTARHRAEVLYRTLIGEWVYRSTGGRRLSAAAMEDLVSLLTVT